MNVLFVCQGNACRSQLAEALAKWLDLEERHRFWSAGPDPDAVDPRAVETLRERGIPAAKLRAKDFGEIDGPADVVVILDEALKDLPLPDAVAGSARRLYWPVKPLASFEGTPQELRCRYAEVRDEIERNLSQLLDEPA